MNFKKRCFCSSLYRVREECLFPEFVTCIWPTPTQVWPVVVVLHYWNTSCNETFQQNVYLQQNVWLVIDFSLRVNDDIINLWCHLHKSLILELPDPFLLKEKGSQHWTIWSPAIYVNPCSHKITHTVGIVSVHCYSVIYKKAQTNNNFMSKKLGGGDWNPWAPTFSCHVLSNFIFYIDKNRASVPRSPHFWMTNNFHPGKLFFTVLANLQ